MEITIIADNREKSSGIPQMLISRNIKTKMFQLIAGDYVINDSIVIERKTKTDFIQSIINGRLFKQCEGMKKTGLIPLIIVEGNPFQTAHNIKPEAIKGALLSISLSWQIPVIRSSGKEDTVELMIMAARQHFNPPQFIFKRGINSRKKQNQKHFFIQNLPCIGPQLAYNLLAHFKTIENIILADVIDLTEVEGIGKKKAATLFNFIREGK